MPYKLPYLPSPNSSQCELADYVEMSCLLDGNKKVSILKASRGLTLLLDGIDPGGLESEDDQISEEIEDALSVIQDRELWCNSKYPFEIVRGSTVKIKNKNFTQAERL